MNKMEISLELEIKKNNQKKPTKNKPTTKKTPTKTKKLHKPQAIPKKINLKSR